MPATYWDLILCHAPFAYSRYGGKTWSLKKGMTAQCSPLLSILLNPLTKHYSPEKRCMTENSWGLEPRDSSCGLQGNADIYSTDPECEHTVLTMTSKTARQADDGIQGVASLPSFL